MRGNPDGSLSCSLSGMDGIFGEFLLASLGDI
jgi:hypothetical protein